MNRFFDKPVCSWTDEIATAALLPAMARIFQVIWSPKSERRPVDSRLIRI
jgi:hypothetical protein